jgi:hypothetical protein
VTLNHSNASNKRWRHPHLSISTPDGDYYPPPPAVLITSSITRPPSAHDGRKLLFSEVNITRRRSVRPGSQLCCYRLWELESDWLWRHTTAPACNCVPSNTALLKAVATRTSCYMCVYKYMYVSMHVCMYVCIYLVCMYLCMRVCVCVYVCMSGARSPCNGYKRRLHLQIK